jgi:DNA gyrase/topoisomerase IV subunit B
VEHCDGYVKGSEHYFVGLVMVVGIAKLSDANDAGTRNSNHCTLILTEGDSAKSLAMSGLSVVGHNHWGVFPLRCACMAK